MLQPTNQPTNEANSLFVRFRFASRAYLPYPRCAFVCLCRMERVCIAFVLAESSWIVMLIFLSVARERRALRVTCRKMLEIGNAVADKFDEKRFEQWMNRLMFWSPWVGYLRVRRRGTLHGGYFDQTIGTKLVRGGVLHGCSDASIMYKLFVSKIERSLAVNGVARDESIVCADGIMQETVCTGFYNECTVYFAEDGTYERVRVCP